MSRIAIIEDDPVINQMYRMKFESAGFEVGVADNGQAGIELVEQFKPDLILLDLQMPNMNGDEALGHIRQLKSAKSTPVIILTNLGEEEAPDNLKKYGVLNYIVKADLTPSQVVERVRHVLK